MWLLFHATRTRNRRNTAVRRRRIAPDEGYRQAAAKGAPSSVTCGDSFPRPGEAFRYGKLCSSTGNFAVAKAFTPWGQISPAPGQILPGRGKPSCGKLISVGRRAFILNTTYHFMDKKPGRGTRSGALLPGFSAFFRRFST